MTASIITPRLTLSPFDDSHIPELLALFRDPHVRRYLLDDALVERDWVEDEVRSSRERFAAGSIGLYAASNIAAPGVLVGFVGFRPFYEPLTLQLVYGVAPAATGRGIATEMAQAVVGVAFGLGFPEVRASTDEPNRASVRVLERLGMKLVATEPGERWPQWHFVLLPGQTGLPLRSARAP